MKAAAGLIMEVVPVVPVIPKPYGLPLVLSVIAVIQVEVRVAGEVDTINQTSPCRLTWAFVTIKNI